MSQQASLLAATLYAVLAVAAIVAPSAKLAWLRGAATVILVLVAVGYAFLLEPDYRPVHSLLEHAITPLLAVLDTTLVEPLSGTRRWWPLSWVLPPLAYLGYYKASDLTVYGFLDTGGSQFVATILGLLAAIVLTGFLLIALTRRTGRQRWLH